MQYDDLVRAATAAIAFGAQLAGHYIGDQWIQTNGQACKKALDGPERRAVAMWHCAKHVITWAATVTAFLSGAGLWLHLPLKPGWLAAGIAVNVITHFIADLRTPLIWIGQLLGRGSYIEHSQVMRPDGAQKTGPGTAIFHLDQSWHIAWLLVASLLIAGPA
jgi:Protein of unknown function (DUF3307)